VRDVCERAGARVIVWDISCSPLPSDACLVQALEELLASDAAAHGGRCSVRLALLDHITSPTAVVMPVKELAAACRRAGVLSLIDGAHAPGHIPGLNVGELDADFYTGNFHKWLFCPKGTAFLYAAESVRRDLQSVVISHNYKHLAVADRFFMQGTLDDTSFLCLHAALRFVDSHGGEAAVCEQNRSLCDWAADMLASAWGTEQLVPRARAAPNLAAIRMPLRLGSEPQTPGAPDVVLFERFNIQSAVFTLGGAYYCRISAQLYNEKTDYERLRDAVLALAAE
jgi:selenocysteine lyase/cysteine desulfurase